MVTSWPGLRSVVVFKGTAVKSEKMNWRQPKPSLQSLEKTPKGKCILSMRQSLKIVLPSLCSSQHLFPAKQLFQKHCALFSILSYGNASTWFFTHSPPSHLASAHPSSASLSPSLTRNLRTGSICPGLSYHWATPICIPRGKSQENSVRYFLRRELLEVSTSSEVLNSHVLTFVIPGHTHCTDHQTEASSE